jgi:hypothetical protein
MVLQEILQSVLLDRLFLHLCHQESVSQQGRIDSAQERSQEEISQEEISQEEISQEVSQEVSQEISKEISKEVSQEQSKSRAKIINLWLGFTFFTGAIK